MAIASNFPSIRPSLLLDFASVGRLDPRVTFSRASSGTYYDGVTTAKAEENLFLQSQDFTTWSNIGTTDTANTAVAPDGTTTADTLDEGTATSGHDIGQEISGVSGQTYTLSAFFKDVDRQYVILACSAGTNTWASAKFDLTAGTAGSTSASGSGWSTTSSSITSVGNSWYRCSITFVSGTTGGITGRLGMATDGTTFTAGQRGLESYTGTNSTIYIWGAQIEQRSAVTAYTPTTTQPITNYIPVLQTAAAGVPRFDHNPTTGEALGLLIEEQRANLLTYSEDFANAAWTKVNSSITSNIIVAPDGTLTGDRSVENTAASQARSVSQTSTTVASTTYTLSVFAKEDPTSAKRYLRLALNNVASTANWAAATFNLATGVVEGTNAAGAGFVVSATSITPVGNGWYRCSISGQIGANTDMNVVISYNPTAATYTNRGRQVYTGDGYSGIYIWGAQLEAGAFSTSYIKTTSASATRNADAASMTGTNFSSWFNNAEGSVYVEYDPYFADTNSTKSFAVFTMNDATANNAIQFFRRAVTGNESIFNVRANSSNFSFINTGTWSANVTKLSCAYQVDDFASVFNAGTVQTDTSGILPVVSQMLIGNDATSNYLNGTIRKLAYYPQRVTDAQLQALTG